MVKTGHYSQKIKAKNNVICRKSQKCQKFSTVSFLQLKNSSSDNLAWSKLAIILVNSQKNLFTAENDVIRQNIEVMKIALLSAHV